MAKKNLTKEIASALKEGLNFEEFLQKENLTEKDINYIIKPFYEKTYLHAKQSRNKYLYCAFRFRKNSGKSI